jgi:hypothetical protein
METQGDMHCKGVSEMTVAEVPRRVFRGFNHPSPVYPMVSSRNYKTGPKNVTAVFSTLNP